MMYYTYHLEYPEWKRKWIREKLPEESRELLGRELPRWSQHLVTGQSISVEQAKEIIRRTDIFFIGSGRAGNVEYEEKVLLSLGAKALLDESYLLAESREASNSWRRDWGYVYTREIHNWWISSCYADGPTGWCHPDGIIFSDTNVGKYTDAWEVYLDWRRLARCFPFLSCEGSLLLGEENDSPRAVSFLIRDGEVSVVSPERVDVHEGREFRRRPEDEEWTLSPLEHGIPWEWIENWQSIAREKNLVS